jgi:hypothetical protein
MAVLSVVLLAALVASCGSDDEDAPCTEEGGEPRFEVSIVDDQPVDQAKARGRGRPPRSDGEAKVAVCTAATAIETLADQQGGGYLNVTEAQLRKVDPPIPSTVSIGVATEEIFEVAATAEVSGVSFRVAKEVVGQYSYPCVPPGVGDCRIQGVWEP